MSDEWVAERAIEIDAPVSAVWKSLTDHELSNRWLWDDGSSRFVTDWEVGGPIQMTGNWHGKVYEDKGTVLAFETEQLLSYTYWGKFWRVPDDPENYTTVQYRLETMGDGTRLTVTHSSFPTYEVFGHWRFYWVTALDRIKAVAERVAG